MISMKDYAQRHNVTYEAVRQQVLRYREDLGDHVIREGRQQFLDDYAVAFLDDRRARHPVVVYQASKDEEIEQLRTENEMLIRKIAAQADRIAELADWKAESAAAIAAVSQTQALLVATQNDLERLRLEAAGYSQQADTATLEASRERQRADTEERRAAAYAAYAAELEAYSALSWWQRRKVSKPVKPVEPLDSKK